MGLALLHRRGGHRRRVRASRDHAVALVGCDRELVLDREVRGGLQLAPGTAGDLDPERLLDPHQAVAQDGVLLSQVPVTSRQPRVVLPPVDAQLLGGVRGRDQQPELDREQLDVEQVDLHVPGDHEALVENAFEYVSEALRPTGGRGCGATHERVVAHSPSSVGWVRL